MEQLSLHKQAMSLLELNSRIRSAIDNELPDLYWVIAEIAECKCNQKGHCYLDLIEKDDHKTVAQIRATIWAYEYRTLSRKFESAAKTPLKQGIRVLMQAAVNFHEIYGLSLNIKDIDPAYTAGEMALRKREIIERLRKECIIDLNRELPLPLVPQRIAVISSPTAAGYGDFAGHLDNNPYGYKFYYMLFPALMQGGDAESSILAAFDRIEESKGRFDIVALIRGGGSAADLSFFDSYAIAARIARFNLPVITGIGHEKDDTVTDMVAHTKMKTPTAVAEFMVSGMRSFAEKIAGMEGSILLHAERLMKGASLQLGAIAQRMRTASSRLTLAPRDRLDSVWKNIVTHLRQSLQLKGRKIAAIEQALHHLNPANVLKRGYSITRLNGKPIKDTIMIGDGDIIDTELSSGRITSVVVIDRGGDGKG
jgi:exodeoxyribonuclease VII large subunit